MLPYLACYMGHADLRGTQYYLRLTADAYPDVIAKAQIRFGYVIPARARTSRDPTGRAVTGPAGRWLAKFFIATWPASAQPHQRPWPPTGTP